MGLKDLKTNDSLEQNGVIVPFGDFRVTVARAGGSNEAYKKELTKLWQPLQKLHELKLLNPKDGDEVLVKLYVNTVILNWETLVEGEWKQGIDFEDGEGLVPFNKQNVTKALTEYPDVFNTIKEESTNAARYREASREDGLKN